MHFGGPLGRQEIIEIKFLKILRALQIFETCPLQIMSTLCEDQNTFHRLVGSKTSKSNAMLIYSTFTFGW